jgi:hypothetical protein
LEDSENKLIEGKLKYERISEDYRILLEKTNDYQKEIDILITNKSKLEYTIEKFNRLAFGKITNKGIHTRSKSPISSSIKSSKGFSHLVN